jgi:hypothetical protein
MLTLGTYTVTVTTSDGCTATATVMVSLDAPPTLSASESDNPTCGLANGAINLTVAPAGTYDYLWSNGITTEDLINLGPGNYSVTVTSQSTGCAASGIFSINDIPGPDISIAATDITCFGDGDGSATVTITNPTTGPYLYEWSNGSTTTTNNLSNTISGLVPNPYSVEVTDDNGCKSAISIDVNTPRLYNA